MDAYSRRTTPTSSIIIALFRFRPANFCLRACLGSEGARQVCYSKIDAYKIARHHSYPTRQLLSKSHNPERFTKYLKILTCFPCHVCNINMPHFHQHTCVTYLAEMRLPFCDSACRVWNVVKHLCGSPCWIGLNSRSMNAVVHVMGRTRRLGAVKVFCQNAKSFTLSCL